MSAVPHRPEEPHLMKPSRPHGAEKNKNLSPVELQREKDKFLSLLSSPSAKKLPDKGQRLKDRISEIDAELSRHEKEVLSGLGELGLGDGGEVGQSDQVARSKIRVIDDDKKSTQLLTQAIEVEKRAAARHESSLHSQIGSTYTSLHILEDAAYRDQQQTIDDQAVFDSSDDENAIFYDSEGSDDSGGAQEGDATGQ